jgi:uncharacterized protein DUF3551
MRMIIATLLPTLMLTLSIGTGPSHAQNYPWCAYKGEGGTNCGFVSYEQCRAGGKAWCDRNPMYQPPAEPAQRRRAYRR